MATLVLIRHALTDPTGTALSGRAPGIPLNSRGCQQAERLAAQLAQSRIRQVFSSPLERARETAAPLAKRLAVALTVSEALTDIDFGEWTGRALAELEPLESWRRWNQCRSCVRVPNGEMILEVQARMMGELDRLCRQFPDEQLAVVSHADPLRTVLAFYLGMPLDSMHRLEISPASVSVVEVRPWGAQVRLINQTAEAAL